METRKNEKKITKPMASWNVHLQQLLQNGRPHWHLYRKDLVEIPWIFRLTLSCLCKTREQPAFSVSSQGNVRQNENTPSEAIAHWLAKTHLLPEQFFLVRLHPTLLKLKVVHLNQDFVTKSQGTKAVMDISERERGEGKNLPASYVSVNHISGHQTFICPCH